ncbi:hypothetical protein OROGR_027626 [Orobanche gracilis]
MQLMKDPVTVSTGITYDRESIEKWLLIPSPKNKNRINAAKCPVTKQVLINPDLTPNHTLRRLIQAWGTLNSIEKIPTPKSPVEKSQILKILKEAERSPESRIRCLRRLRSIAGRNGSSRNHLQAAGAVHFLLNIVRRNDDVVSRDEALSILLEMELSDSDLTTFFNSDHGDGSGDGGGDISEPLVRVLENGNYRSRAQAMSILKSAFDIADPAHLIGSKPEIFAQTVRILRDREDDAVRAVIESRTLEYLISARQSSNLAFDSAQFGRAVKYIVRISQRATKTALKLLMELCPWGRNRVKAVQSGVVYVLIDLLLDDPERRVCELALTVLDQLCSCAEGRAELLSHGAGLAIVSKKILRVSGSASDKGVRILGSILKYPASSRVLQEMLQLGVVSKLCLVVSKQVEANRKTKERAREILRMHSRVWKSSSCFPSHLLSSYP